MRRLTKPYIRAAFYKNRLNYVLTLFLKMLESAFNPLLAVLLQVVVDTATGEIRLKIADLVGLFLLTLFVFMIIELLYRSFYCRFTRRANLQYRQKLFDELTQKGIAAFSSEQTSTYLSMLTADASVVEEKIFGAYLALPSLVATAIVGLGLMLWYDWQLSLAAVVFSILPVAITAVFGKRMAESEKRVSSRNASFTAAIKDLLTGFSVVKSFQAEAEAKKLHAEQNRELEQTKYQRRRIQMLVEILSGGASAALQLGVFILGAVLVLQGRITTGVIVAFVQLTGVVIYPLTQLPGLLSGRKGALALIEKAAEALQANTKTGEGETVSDLGVGISFRDLCFAYEEGKPILRDINLDFQAGKSYAIVGSSGSGKTTLLNLLLGSHDTYTGSLTLNGTELRDIDPNSLYALIAIIQQNVFIFDSTIEENITMFKSFPESAIRDAIQRSGLEELIAKKGRDYRCGENGCNLSGGERQRISIARCLLKNTQVLLMDEATAALDAQTAANVTGAILDVEGLTRIIVTHKLEAAALSGFDEIIVLRGGKIAERGSFEALIARHGYFYALYSVTKNC